MTLVEILGIMAWISLTGAMPRAINLLFGILLIVLVWSGS